MAYSIKADPGSLVISFAREPDSNVMVDMVRSIDKAISLLDEIPPCCLVIDFRRISMTVDDLLKVSSALALGPEPVTHHPNVVETLFVTTDPAVRTAVGGLANPAFGKVKLSLFNTLDEALAYSGEKMGIAHRA